jgi:methylenetetrahydrofolate reductase (NADPH)
MAAFELDDDASSASAPSSTSGTSSASSAEEPHCREAATFSFELYPPRDAAAEAALYDSLAHLVAAGPEFISVTYGAGGGTRDRSLGVLGHLLRDTDVTLRGDPPEDAAEGETGLGDLGSAGELVQLIHRVQKERVPFSEADVPGFPGAKRLAKGEKVTIAIAAFPNGHPRSRSRTQDIDTLLAKQAAGANLAITQLFFEADDYLGFVDRARAAGVTMRILPGIMPVLSPARLNRIIELTGETLPTSLLRDLENAEDPAQVGIDHAISLGEELLRGGAAGLHLYTFNRHRAPLAVLDGVGLLSTSTARPLKENA